MKILLIGDIFSVAGRDILQEMLPKIKNGNIIGILMEGSAQIIYTDYNGNEVLEKPKTKYQNFVHMCDYLASRKCLLVPFDKNSKLSV